MSISNAKAIAEGQAEGEEMSDPLSLSVFTMEADRKPIAVFAAKKHQEAEAFFNDERVRAKLQAANSGGVPLIGDRSFSAFVWQMALNRPATGKGQNGRRKSQVWSSWLISTA